MHVGAIEEQASTVEGHTKSADTMKSQRCVELPSPVGQLSKVGESKVGESMLGESKVGENKVGWSKFQVHLRYSRGNNIILRNVTKTEIKSHNSTGHCRVTHSRVTLSQGCITNCITNYITNSISCLL
eukprot:GFUD01126417.1.p1 GENE.GFUD01126417.1~~GFUD01126417.1.p1  ORF type:complete len:128 (+),score=6.12 GFUD01126417.1:74-457(+)